MVMRHAYSLLSMGLIPRSLLRFISLPRMEGLQTPQNLLRGTLLAILLITGCATGKNMPSSGWLKMNEETKMTQSQIRKAELAAKKGDISSAEKLYQHYIFSSDDANLEKSDFWLKWLADYGVPYAEFNYGKSLIDEHRKIKEGIRWMLKAKKSGYHAGDDLLNKYKNEGLIKGSS